MLDKRILVIEEGKSVGEVLKQCLLKDSVNFVVEKNPDKAIQALSDFMPDVIAIDPYAFGSMGFELIKNLISHENSPVIVAVSEHRDPEIIVKLIKSGIYDYIVLNRDNIETRNKIRHACDAAELHKLKKMHERELSILDGYFSARNGGGKIKPLSQDAALISSIRSNFSQGSGIGSMLTLVSMISKRAARVDGKRIIDENMFKLLEDNAGQVQRVIKAFERLENLATENPELVYEPLDGIHEIINNETGKISPIASGYGKKIKVSDKVSWENKYVNWNAAYFEIIFSELLWNAVKFSPPKSEIMVFSEMVNHGIKISVLNPPVLNIYGTMGIPEDFQNLIFEPFFRLSRLIFEEIPTLDFGLGLALVNMLVKKLKATIKISSLESYIHMTDKPRQLVSMEVWLPTYSKTLAGYVDEADGSVRL